MGRDFVVRRIDFGHFVRPADETGTGRPRVEAVLGYAVLHPSGVLLFDTGMAEADDETEVRYRPVRRSLTQALKDAGMEIDEVRWVSNCHLHFDHCGSNRFLAGRPTFVQSVELRNARTTDNYTISSAVDFPGANYQEVDGEAEILSHVFLIPTPGHTEGHQALAVRRPDGTIILAGQAFNTAFDYGSDYLAWRAQHDRQHSDDTQTYAAWVDRLARLDPRRVVFAHDYAVWEPSLASF